MLRAARNIVPGALTVVGGHAATLQPEEFQEPYVDVIVQGEGEETFAELCARWVLRVRLALPSHHDSRFTDWVLRLWASSEDDAATRFEYALHIAGIASSLPAAGERVQLRG